MPAGKYRHRFTIEQPVGTPDAAGHIDLTDDGNWAAAGSRWCEVIPRGGGERVVFDQVAAEVTHLVEVRSDSLTRTIQPTWRLTSGTKTLNIQSVYDPDGRRQKLHLACMEVI